LVRCCACTDVCTQLTPRPDASCAVPWVGTVLAPPAGRVVAAAGGAVAASASSLGWTGDAAFELLGERHWPSVCG
jgi:hypothetical protein